jgi:cell division protein FtsL
MNRFSIVILAALSVCALSLITAQHDARRTHVALERAQGEARRLDADWNHLRMQQTSLSAAALIDARARGQLAMDSPHAQRTLHALRDPSTGEMKLGSVTLLSGSQAISRGVMQPSAGSVVRGVIVPPAAKPAVRAR